MFDIDCYNECLITGCFCLELSMHFGKKTLTEKNILYQQDNQELVRLRSWYAMYDIIVNVEIGHMRRMCGSLEQKPYDRMRRMCVFYGKSVKENKKQMSQEQ